jgi:hypothetical protein
MSCAALKLSIGWFSSSKLRKASCFSAVSPVCGWNQCVKCVTPFSIAHSLMASATARRGRRRASCRAGRRPAGAGRPSSAGRSRIWRVPKVFVPK